MIIQAWTPMIRTRDMRYPVYLADFRADTTKGNVSIGSWVYDVSISEFGYFPVLDSEIPVGDVVTEGEPELREDGSWYKTWASRDYTEDEIQSNLYQAKTEAIQKAKQSFEQFVNSGVTVGEHRFSTSTNSVHDFQFLLHTAEGADPEATFLIQDANGEILSVSAEEAVSTINGIFTAYTQAHQSLLTYIRSVNEVTELAGISLVPFNFLGE